MSQPPAMQFSSTYNAQPSPAATPFKSQLWKLNQEIEGFSRRVGGGTEEGDSAASTAFTGGYKDKDDLKMQVGGLHQTMENLNGHLERERIEKRQTQDEVERLKLQLKVMQQQPLNTTPHNPPQQPVHIPDRQLEQDIKEKNEQIATLREEKAVMKEWLDRGVTECKRVAEEVTRLRKELEDNDGEKGKLGEEKARLEVMLQQVMAEVRETTEQLNKERGDRAAAQDNVAEKTRAANESSEQMRQCQAECDRLAGEVARLMERQRDTEEAEMQLRSLVAGLKRTSTGYLALHTAVEQDRLADLIRFNDSIKDESEAAGTGPLHGVVQTGKGCLAELQDVLLALRSIIRTRIEESQERSAEVARRETDQAQIAVQGAHRTEQELRERHAIERNLMEGKLLELETELASLSDSNLKSQQMLNEAETQKRDLQSRLEGSSAVKSANVSSISVPVEGGEMLESRLTVYENRVIKLETQNGKLKEKNKKMKVDWSKVTETRQYCQQLEVEKRTMQEYIEKMERENEMLRKRGYQPNMFPREGRMSPSKRHETDQSTAVWRDWQRQQTNWEAWKETRTTVPTFSSPTSRPRPTPHHHANNTTASLYQHPPVPNRVSPPRGSGPWMPSP